MMNTDDVVGCLARVERRLATLADQVQEIQAQARHATDRLNLLRRDLELFREAMQPETEAVHR